MANSSSVVQLVDLSFSGSRSSGWQPRFQFPGHSVVEPQIPKA